MKKYGLKAIGDELGMTMADFDHGRTVSNPNGLLAKSLNIANAVLDNDGVISIAKFKCHGLTVVTGAVKNQFGCVPGAEKGQSHAKMPDVYNFSSMLVDVAAFVKPRLYIMDAIVAMEGNGPQSGDPRSLNVLLFSTDPVALDAVACKIINLDPTFVPTSELGEKAGLGTFRLDNIEIVGDPIERFLCPSFKIVRKKPVAFSGSHASRLAKRLVTPRPVISSKACTRCGTCVRQCPVNPKAVDWLDAAHKKPPQYNYDRCIRCYCCHEFCPSKAIFIKRPLLGRLFPMIAFVGLFISSAFYSKKRCPNET
jgi:Pyruvate/2-oxoacid:ferredoxin oxidoreductase delta subunit